MNFIGREEEIQAISYILSQDGYQGINIYGRRRIGKTELIKHCLKGNKVSFLYFQCTRDNEINNVTSLTQEIEKFFHLTNLHFSSFILAIDFIFQKSKENNLCLVIDEYPYIRSLVQGLDSQLQVTIDKNKATSKLKLILSGSSVSTMESLLSESNPMYRRLNLKILLKEMDYYDSSFFYPSFSAEDKVRLYAAFGGVPYYNEQINEKLTVKENIILLLSGKFAHLSDEITLSLKSELSKIGGANSVFLAIAQGAFHYSDILSKSGINSSPYLSDILEKLMKMDFLKYVSPINDKNNKRKSGYIISDSATRFFYRYIFKNQSAIEIENDDSFYHYYIEKDFEEQYVSKAFEEISKQYLIRLNRTGKFQPHLTDIGTYWYDNPEDNTNGQFDVVTKSEKGYVFYEAKFTKSKIDDKVVNEEIEQAKNTKLNPINFGFISRSGFRFKKENTYHLITLNDLFSL